MPRKSNRSALLRQWHLLRELPKKPPGISVSVLVSRLKEAGYSMSKRTVERDLRLLEDAFGLECLDDGTSSRWSWFENVNSEMAGTSVSEAVSLVLIGDVLKTLVPTSVSAALNGRVARAKEKLDALSGNSQCDWSRRVRYVSPTLPFKAPKTPAGVLAKIHEAILRRRMVEGYYNPAEKRTHKYSLHPQALVQFGAISYLVAFCAGEPTPRIYALHRFASLEILKTPAFTPNEFSLDRLLGEGLFTFGAAGSIQLKARVSGKLASLLEEGPLSNDQKVVPGKSGTYILTAHIADGWLLQFWVLSQGPEIEILEPKAFRKKIADLLRGALKNYESTS